MAIFLQFLQTKTEMLCLSEKQLPNTGNFSTQLQIVLNNHNCDSLHSTSSPYLYLEFYFAIVFNVHSTKANPCPKKQLLVQSHQ